MQKFIANLFGRYCFRIGLNIYHAPRWMVSLSPYYSMHFSNWADRVTGWKDRVVEDV